MVHIIFKKSHRSSRDYDRQELYKAIQSGNKNMAGNASKSLYAINHESREVESMRESLIKAHREQNTNEIKDIHEYVQTHSKYQRKK